jgi:hypothetical protein
METNFETLYRDQIKKLSTRKKFSIQKIEGAHVTIEESQEICGQKEPKRMVLKSPQEMEEFVKRENEIERRIQASLASNEFPMR